MGFKTCKYGDKYAKYEGSRTRKYELPTAAITLKLNGPTAIYVSTTGEATCNMNNSEAQVEFIRDGDQDIDLANATFSGFNNLVLKGSGIKTFDCSIYYYGEYYIESGVDVSGYIPIKG